MPRQDDRHDHFYIISTSVEHRLPTPTVDRRQSIRNLVPNSTAGTSTLHIIHDRSFGKCSASDLTKLTCSSLIDAFALSCLSRDNLTHHSVAAELDSQARASAKLAAGASIAIIASTSSALMSKPIYCEEGPSSSGASKLSIYPQSDPKVEIVPVQTELERQIGSARRSLAHLTTDTRHSVRSLVDRWISIERSLEGEVRSLIPECEPLTPGLLYVGVATLAGSIFTRYRAFPIRILTPPLALIAGLNFFNPHLAHNLGAYYTEVEQQYLPALTEQRRNLQKQGKKYLDSTTKNIHELKDKTEQGVRSGLETVEQKTGLKLGDVVVAKDEAKYAIKDQMKAV